DQSVVAHDVVDVGADGGHQIDASEVRAGAGETDVERVAVHHQRGLAEAELGQLLAQLTRLAFGQIEVVEHDQLAGHGLGRQRHLEAELANLLVEARAEHSGTGAMSLAAADEDRSTAVAVTGGSSALLAPELLAGARDVAALAR